ncbi:TPA: MFS transporter [Bacillus toyonensis]|uniref:MFS transporter n=1 Tax=Bacillus toyonensis TaxID=155322 RepID=UPI0036E7E0A7|nr:MFS transporter [Bacillus toyonensis]
MNKECFYAIDYLLALVIFCMTTSEFMVAGMMNELVLAFQVSVSSIGYFISAYAGAMVIGGPILTAILLRMRSKQALLFLMFATVLGLPITTVISQYFGWRISFGAVSVLVLVSGIMIQRLLPSPSNKEQLNWKGELLRFKNIHLWAAYVTSMFIIGGTFAAFSYFTPIFTNVTGFSSASTPSFPMILQKE